MPLPSPFYPPRFNENLLPYCRHQPAIIVSRGAGTAAADHGGAEGGHGLAPLQILSSHCHFAAIYRRSPAGLGLPVPNAFKAMKDMSDEDKTKLNALLQEIAWDTVSHHPMSGVMKPVAAN